MNGDMVRDLMISLLKICFNCSWIIFKGEIKVEEYKITLESIKERVKNGRITVEEIKWLIAKVEENNKK
jgi:hypothetical protein